MTNVIPCTLQHLDEVARLFNQYRQFYQQPDDLPAATRFIRTNLETRASRIFLLLDEQNRTVAFAQLYPAMCSVLMQPFYWLYDLFVDPAARRQGHARTLMQHIITLLRAEGIQRLSLDTARSNVTAQQLYESLGYKAEQEFITYHKVL